MHFLCVCMKVRHEFYGLASMPAIEYVQHTYMYVYIHKYICIFYVYVCRNAMNSMAWHLCAYV